MIETFSRAVNFIEKRLFNRFFRYTLPVNSITYPDIDYPVSYHFEIIDNYKYLKRRSGGEKVCVPVDRKFFPRRKTLAGKSYMANPNILRSYNEGMEYHTEMMNMAVLLPERG